MGQRLRGDPPKTMREGRCGAAPPAGDPSNGRIATKLGDPRIAIAMQEQRIKQLELKVYVPVKSKNATGYKRVRSMWLDDNKGEIVRSRLVAQEVAYEAQAPAPRSSS